MQQRIKVFVSYAHEDDVLRQKLHNHLSELTQEDFIVLWHDREISPGADWQHEIDVHLHDAHIILLLISADFLASQYCKGIEVKRALERHAAGEARVIPIILRHVLWKKTPIRELQALPKDGKPVRSWQDEDEALLNVAEGIEKAVSELLPLQWYREGDVLCESKQFKEALAAFEQAIKEALAALEENATLDSEYAKYYRRKGDALWGLGRFEDTLEAFEQAIALDPQNVVAYISKGWVLNDLKRYEEALAASNQAIRLDQKAARAYQGKGWALYHLQRYEEALIAYEQAFRLGCQPTDPYYEIVRGLNALGVTKSSPLQHDSTPDGKGLYWHYPELTVHWSSETSIHATGGSIRDKWANLGWEQGILGYPTTDVAELPDGVGRHCHFQHGCIYWSPETDAHEVHGPIRDKWASLGWEQSFLGYPIADQKDSPDGVGCISNFQHGSIYWTAQTEAHAVSGEIRDKWESLRWELGPLGYPISDQEPAADGIGRYQHFQRGSIFWSLETGAHAVHGPIWDKWANLDRERGRLGYPMTDVMELPDGIGRHCHFQHGCIYWSPKTEAHEVHGPIRDKWVSLGWEQSFLGYPTADVAVTPDRIGRFSRFQHGSIYWTPETGAHAVHGEIQNKWADHSWERGRLKYPISDQEPTADGVGRYQHFQEGSIFWSPETGAHAVYGNIRERWKSLEWERGLLGYPITDHMPAADGVGSCVHFQHGSIYWTPQRGAHEVYGEIRNQWVRMGWEQSSLGYPATGEMDAPDTIGRISYFQYGAIYSSSEKYAIVLRGLFPDLQQRFADLETFARALEQASQPAKFLLSAIVFHIDHPSDKNRGYYRIGKNLDANGIAAGGWSTQIEVPSAIAKENQGTGIALVDLDGNGHPDLIVFRIDQSRDENYGFYRVGKNLDENNSIAHENWSEPIRVPGPFGKQNQGAGIAVADLNRSRYPDLIVFYINSSEGESRGYYRIGKNLNSDGMVTGDWMEPLHVPGSFGTENHCIGITVANLDGNRRADLIVFYIEHQDDEKRGYYRVGKHLDSDGVVTGGWSEPFQIPGSFGTQTHGASVAITDLNRNGRPDLVVFYIEHPKGENRGYYRIGRNLDANGFATGGWSKPLRVPGWFGTKNQGAGIAFTTLL